MRYLVLGPLTAVAADGSAAALGGPKQRLVLASLVFSAGRTVSVDELVDTVWPAEPPPRARHAIQTYVSALRGVLDDAIDRVGAGYRLAIDPDVVDAHRFTALAAAGREHLHTAPVSAAALLRDALALWRGPPLADLGGHRTLLTDVQRLGELRIDAIEDRLAADLAIGWHREAAAELEALTEEHPYRERLHELHLLALYRSGRQVDALQAYQRVRDRLVDELGVEPGPALEALHRRILHHDPSLSSGAASSTRDRSHPSSPALPAVRGYEVREQVGVGSHGAVYRAYEPSSGREVAVKILANQLSSDPSVVAQLEARWSRITRLDHPHLLPILDRWRDPEGGYVVTPWIAHGSLEQALRHGPWSLPAALRLVEQLGDALAALHAEGLAHGHLVPTNVLLGGDGDALLSDAGLSQLVTNIGGDGHRSTDDAQDVRNLAGLVLRTLTAATVRASGQRASATTRTDLPVAVMRVLDAWTQRDTDVELHGFLRELRRAAGADVVALGGGDATAVRTRNPYKGLEAFQEADARDFHGREADIERLMAAVETHRLVAVVGPSGSGKSSLVRAGLLPRLLTPGTEGTDRWLFTDLFPGARPFEALATALVRIASRRPDGLLTELLDGPHGLVRAAEALLPGSSRLLLLIDQFEELYTLTADPARRQAFHELLVAAATDPGSRVHVVLTLRADHLDRPLERHDLGMLVRRGLVPLTVPSPSELTAAVLGPADAVGVRFEDGLAADIVAEVAEQPGSLPLLQHVLDELFRRRQGNTVPEVAYRELGGLRGALGRRAEELYRSLSIGGQRVTRQLFLRLAFLAGTDSRPVRRRVRRSELTDLGLDPDQLETVLRRFGAHRLLTFDRDATTRGATVEVAHEALFDAWPRLRAWIDEVRDDLQRQRRLADAAAEWEAAQRAEGLLLTGGRLAGFEAWAEGTNLALTGPEQQLLAASQERRDSVTSVRRRRRHRIVTALSVLTLAALVLAGTAVAQRNRSAVAESLARSRALAAASMAELGRDADLALLLALEAVDVHHREGRPATDVAIDALHAAVLAHRVQLRIPDAGDIAVAGSDTLIVGGSDPTGPRSIDLRSGHVHYELPPAEAQVTGLATSADGRLAAITYAGPTPTLVFDVETGEELARLPAPGPARFSPTFSADGSRLAVVEVAPAAPTDGPPSTDVVVHDLASGRELIRIPGATAEMDAALHPDGEVVALTEADGVTAVLHSVADGAPLDVLGDPSDARSAWRIAWWPTGDRLLVQTTMPRAEVLVFDAASGDPLLAFPVGSDPTSLCLSADGTRLVTASADDQVQVWDAGSGDRLAALPGRGLAVACSADGRRVAVSGNDRAALVFDATATGAAEILSIAGAEPWTVGWSPDGSRLVSTHLDGTLQIHDAATGALVGMREDQALDRSLWLAISDRFVAASAASDDPGLGGRELTLYDAGTLAVHKDLGVGALPIAFDPAGDLLLAGEVGRATLFDAHTGRVIEHLEPPELLNPEVAQVVDGALHPDGRHALVSVAIDRAWWFDRHTGRAIALPASGPVRRVALSPDGARIALGGQDGTVDVIEVADLDLGASLGTVTDVARVSFRADGLPFGLEFSPDGALVATSGFEGTLAVWDTASGERRLAITHEGRVGGAVFSPDGRRLAVGIDSPNADGDALRVYTLDVAELVTIARAKVTRGLSLEECQLHLVVACPAA